MTRPMKMLPRSFLCTVLLVLAILSAAVSPTAHSAGATLRVSAIPDEAPTELQRKFAPLGRYLEQQTGTKVEFTPVTDYAAVVEALATRKVDLAWLGGFTYVQAKHRSHGTVRPIVQREEDTHFTSKFITSDDRIRTLADLKGKTFAFGSPASTSGHLMPRYFLLQAGIVPDRDFSSIAYSGAHDATAMFVQSGKVAAGVLNASVWDKLVEQKRIDIRKLRVIATTPAYHDYNWTVRDGLDAALVRKLTEAFLRLDPANPEHRRILDLQRASRFVPVRAEDYADVENAARVTKLLPD